MKMNKKGAAMFFILITIAYFMVGMIFYQFLTPLIDIERSAANLNCSNPDDWGDMGLCLLLDGTVPIFIIGILSVVAGGVTNKLKKVEKYKND